VCLESSAVDGRVVVALEVLAGGAAAAEHLRPGPLEEVPQHRVRLTGHSAGQGGVVVPGLAEDGLPGDGEEGRGREARVADVEAQQVLVARPQQPRAVVAVSLLEPPIRHAWHP